MYIAFFKRRCKMLAENLASVMLNMSEWELFLPFTGNRFLADASLAEKDLTRHNHYEILVGLEGAYPYYYHDHCYNCRPGSIFFISPMLEHESYYTSVAKQITHMWLSVAEDSLLASISQATPDTIKHIYKCKIVYNNYVPKLQLHAVWNSLLKTKKISDRNRFRLKLALHHLFLAIIESKPLSVNEYQGEIMQRARVFIKENFRRKIDLGHLAAKMGYSKFHFARLFKQYHTVTVQEYIDRQRLHEVDSLLTRRISKKEIAYRLGFSSPSAFSNWHVRYRNNPEPRP